jgi:F-type H+-transporting ATPase subunit b
MANETTQTHESTGADGHASGGGLPQFQFVWWPGQVVWLLLIFVVLYVLLSKLFLPRVGGTIQTRADKIAADVAQARDLKTQAEAESATALAELAKARTHAQRTASEAKAKANAEAATRQAAEEAVLAEKLAVAEDRIRVSRDAALGNVRTIASDIAAAITAKLTGVAATADEVETALTAAKA